MSAASVRRLHIGGMAPREGWEILNIQPGPDVDHVGDARDLSAFAADTFAELYASHVLEHVDYKDEVLGALKEWRRVLTPGGRLYVGVPDMDALARLILSGDRMRPDDHYFVMRMLFGGHVDPYDYHQTGFNQILLVAFLIQAGFVRLRRVRSFGLFADASDMTFMNVPISLNLIAEKPGP